MDTTWSADDDLRTILESLHVLANISTTDASMAFDVHEVTDGDDNLLDLLCEFSSWCEDQSLASLELRINLLKARD